MAEHQQGSGILRAVTASHPGDYLAEDYDVAAYYLENSIAWNRWDDTWYFKYARPADIRPDIPGRMLTRPPSRTIISA